VNAYLDASVIVALLTVDLLSSRADTFLRTHTPVLIVSDFAAAEFASVIARRVRTRELSARDARQSFLHLDSWVARAAQRAQTSSADIRTAETFLRRLDVTLRTPDAINLAIAQRVGATLVTFDAKMAAAARTLGTAVAAA
jgi:uncharacterized protein